MTHDELLDSDNITVTSEGNVSGSGNTTGETMFWPFVEEVRKNEDGWRVSLLNTSPSERIVTQTAIFGGIFVTPAYTPNTDLCGLGGQTAFLAGYYETGTAFDTPIFYTLPEGAPETTISIRHTETYSGMPPSRLIFHAGLERGTKLTIQLSTGEFLSLYGRPAQSTDNAIMEQYSDPGEDFEFINPACDWQNYQVPVTP